MSREITVTDDMFRMLCGLVRGDTDPNLIIAADATSGGSWDALRALFPAEGYTDLPADEDGVANAGWGTAFTGADDYEPSQWG